MGMTGIPKSQVSRLCGEINERVHAFLDRPIEGDWPYPSAAIRARQRVTRDALSGYCATCRE